MHSCWAKHQVQAVFNQGSEANMKISQPSNPPKETQDIRMCMSHLSLRIINVMSLIYLFFVLFLYQVLTQPPETRLIEMDFLIVTYSLFFWEQSKASSLHISLLICAVCLHCDLSCIEMLCLFLLNPSSKCKILGYRDFRYFSGMLQIDLSAS